MEPAHALSGTSTARRIFVGSDSLSSDDMIDSTVVNFDKRNLTNQQLKAILKVFRSCSRVVDCLN